MDMGVEEKKLNAIIPADYTKSEFALQYFVELHGGPGNASLFPGLDLRRGNQPYFVIPQST